MSLLRQSLMVFLALSLLTGVAYPVLVTVTAQLIFPHQANGSLIDAGGKVVGSALIGQQFDAEKYFWPRPSATSPPYNAAASTGSNLGPTNPAQLDAVRSRTEAAIKVHATRHGPVPVDLVTASGSGVDPHISPATAQYQVDRVAQARGVDAQRVRELVSRHIEGRTFGVLGEPRVNVLRLNMALDSLK